MWGLFLYGAYKCNVVVVIKVGAYIYVVLILHGCLLSHFMVVCSSQHNFTATWKLIDKMNPARMKSTSTTNYSMQYS